MTGLQKLKVAFDEFDDKGPLPNLNDSIFFNELYKRTHKSSRYLKGHFIIPWIFDKFNSEEIELIKTVAARGKVIYPVGIKHNESIYTLPGSDIFSIQNHNNIDYFIIYLEEEPIRLNDFRVIKNTLETLVDRKKLIFFCNNLEVCKESIKDHVCRIGVGMELHTLQNLSWNRRDIHIDFKDDKIKKNKKFSIFNYSGNANYDYRQATIIYLSHLNLLQHAHYSHKREEEIIYDFTGEKKLKSLFKQIIKKDSKKIEERYVQHDSLMVSLMDDSYFSVVLEAYFDSPSLNQTYVTEKSLRPMLAKKPFIIVGQKGTLKELKKRGYKTFHPFINEEYDEENNPVKRYFKVITEINKLCKLSIEELHNFMEPLKEVVEHNYNHLYYRIESEKQYLKSLINENT